MVLLMIVLFINLVFDVNCKRCLQQEPVLTNHDQTLTENSNEIAGSQVISDDTPSASSMEVEPFVAQGRIVNKRCVIDLL